MKKRSVLLKLLFNENNSLQNLLFLLGIEVTVENLQEARIIILDKILERI